MKKKILLAIITIGLILSMALPALPVGAQEFEKVPIELQPTDEKVLEAITLAGADKRYIGLVKDYGLKADGKNPYSRTYSSTREDLYFLEVSQLPMVDAVGDKLNPGWLLSGNKYYSNSIDKSFNNLFWAEVYGTQVILIIENDQPYGAKQGDYVLYNPQLFLKGKEIFPSNAYALRYDTDPYNANYQHNVLEWDYGICKRQIRIVEGMYRETWLFADNPKGEVKVVHNQYGSFPLSLGQYAIDDDVELVSTAVFDAAEYPFRVSASSTFHPDANPETTSVDGTTVRWAGPETWASIRTSAGTGADDDNSDIDYPLYIRSHADADKWTANRRGVFLFDTSALPDTAIISAATLSLYGTFKQDLLSCTPNINIYSSDPDTNTAVIAADYNIANWGSTAFCDASITYAGWDTTDYNDFAFNAAGLAAISKTGVSKFGTRNANYDVAAVTPNYISNKWSSMNCHASEEGAGFKPELVVTYTAVVPPTVTTQAASSVEDTTATGNANITVTGGANADMRGGAWDTATQGDPGAAAPPEDYSANATEHGNFGTGAFTVSMTGLPTGTTIYFRPYAHNSAGWNWGTEINFLTKPAPPTYVVATDGVHVDKVVITWVKSFGATDYQVYQDGAGLGWIGDVATHDDLTADAPTITPGVASATDGVHTDKVVLSLAGESANIGTVHVYKVRARNATGESDDSATDQGHRGVGALTYQWQRSAGDADAGYGNIGGATTDPYDDTAAPAGVITPGTADATDGTQEAHVVLSLAGESVADGAGRWYRCVLDASGAAQQISTTNRGYRTTGALTYQWQRSAGDADAGYGDIGGATTDPYNDVGAPAPTITPGAATASDGTSTAHITLSIAGESTNTFGRFYKCVLSATDASNSPATSTNDRGYRGVGAITYQWQRSAGDADAGYGALGGATTDPYNDTTAPAPTVTPGVASASDGTSTAHVVLSIAGESGNNGAGRWYYCVVSASGAVPQDTDHNRGYRGTAALTYQWQRSAGDGDAGYGALGGATTDPYNDTTAPAGIVTPGVADATDGTSTAHVVLSIAGESVADGAGRWYYCEVSMSDAATQDTTHNRGYRTTGGLTYQWLRSAGDADAGFGNIGGATTDPYNDVGAPAGIVTPGSATATDGTSEAHVTLSIAGESVADGAGRWYYCEVSATGATTQDTTHNRGYRTTGAITYQWQRSAGDADAGYGALGGATTDPFDDVTAPQATVTPGSATATDGTSTAHITLSIAGESANTFGRWYYCEVSATGTTTQDTDHNRGYRGVGALTYQWQRSAADADAAYGALGGATTDPYNDTTAPAPTVTPGAATASDGTQTAHVVLSIAGESGNNGAGRWYYCEVSASGAVTQDTDHNRGYRGTAALTYQWYRSAADADGGFGVLGGATTDPYNDVGAPAGVITPGVADASDGTVLAHVVLSLAGESVADGAGRWYYCEVSMTDAVTQDTTHNRGYRTTGAITYQWQRSAADADAGYGNIGGATTDPYNDVGAPADGSGRWYLCLLDATGTAQAESTHDRGFRGALATIETLHCTGFDELWGILNGRITDEGVPAVTIVGFDYGETAAYGNSWTNTDVYATGDEFWAWIGSLHAGTVYHFRAKASNGFWAYGADMVFSTVGSPTLYEYLNTGGDGDSDDIYEERWTAQQFDCGAVGHTITSVRVPLKRTLLPGDVTLEIYHANVGDDPTGDALTSATLDGDVMSTAAYVWYEFDVDDISLDGGEAYAIVVKATSGTAANYIEWWKDTGGGLANSVGRHSTDSGITWIDDAPIDYLFEIWGEPVLDVEGAKVFSGYIEEGDWLIVLLYRNIYPPHYPDQDPESHFYIQGIDGATVKLQVVCSAWGYRPGSIYVSPETAATLEWGAGYKIRMYGDFGANPYSEYVLLDADWRGSKLTDLDKWVMLQADVIGEADGVELTQDVVGVGEVLNQAGYAIFLRGIPDLDAIRPNLFELRYYRPELDATSWTHALQGGAVWTTRLGPTVSGALTDVGNMLNTDGKSVAGFIVLLMFVGLIIVSSLLGNMVPGLALGYVALLGGAYAGVIAYALLGVVTLLFVVFGVYKVWLTRG